MRSPSLLVIALSASLAATAPGCRALVELFETDTTADTDGGFGADADLVNDANTTDAFMPVDARPNCTPWGYKPAYFDPCTVAAPEGDVELGVGDWEYDTNSGALTDPQFNVVFPPSVLMTQPGGGPEVRIVSVNRFTTATGSVLRVVGQRPLIIAAWQDVGVDGLIDVGTKTGIAGAGANPSECSLHAPTSGESDKAGSGGGGGGGFGDDGGDGGDGDGGDAVAGAKGSKISRPSFVRGGCNGGDGGKSGATGPPGGIGGGALHIASQTQVRVGGSMSAAGGGGGLGSAGRSGGGGGGSGGFLGLEGTSVQIDPSGILAANGGGGGGGCDNNEADPGEDGLLSSAAAQGGDKEGMGTAGGNGGALMSTPGEPASGSNRGGGGGGGGVGFIVVHTDSTNIDNAAVISPAVITVGLLAL